jgi:predicted phosphohydrolase
VFGHLHNVPARRTADRIAEEVRYVLTSCDYLGFIPKLVGEVG